MAMTRNIRAELAANGATLEARLTRRGTGGTTITQTGRRGGTGGLQ